MDRYIDTDKLVERWGGHVARNTLVNWRAAGKGPPYTKLGHKVVYPLDELERWERANLNNHTPPPSE